MTGMRWLAIPLTIAAALLGIALHWHVSLLSTTNVYDHPAPKAVHRPMTLADCKAIKGNESESVINDTFGGDQSGSWSDSSGETVSWDYDFAFYAIPKHPELCEVYYGPAGRVNHVETVDTVEGGS